MAEAPKAPASMGERIHKWVHRFFAGSLVIVTGLQKLQAVDFTKYVPPDMAGAIIGGIGLTIILLEFAGPIVNYFETAQD